MNAILKMAWRNVRKNWRHSLAALLSISVGFVALGLFQGYIGDLERRLTAAFHDSFMLGDLIVERRGAQEEGREDPWVYVLGPEDQAFLEERFRASGQVTGRVRFLDVSGMITSGKNSAVFVGYGHDVAEGADLRGPARWNAVAGKPLYEVPADREAALIGRGLAHTLDCSDDESVRSMDDDLVPIAIERPFKCPRPRVQLATTTQKGQINAVEPEVVGLTNGGFKEVDLRLVVLPLPLAQRLTDSQAISRYAVSLRDPSRAKTFAADLMTAARAHGLELDARPWREHKIGEYFTNGLQILSTFRGLVMVVVLIIAGMSVFNTMAKAVGERVREIGTLRSLGFRRRQITLLFTVEAALLALSGVGLGLVLVVPLSLAVRFLGIRYKAGTLAEDILLQVGLVPVAYLTTGLFLTAVATLAAYLPARRAAAMKIPDALGHV